MRCHKSENISFSCQRTGAEAKKLGFGKMTTCHTAFIRLSRHETNSHEFFESTPGVCLEVFWVGWGLCFFVCLFAFKKK